jgi:hypothetical protein
MDILDRNKITKAEFFNWLVHEYGVEETGPKSFETAPYVEQHRAIARFLGYSIAIQDNLTTKELDDFTWNIVSSYEELKIKYPQGLADPLAKMKNMSCKEISEAYPDTVTQRPILRSLCYALIPIEKDYVFKAVKLLSLKDALVEKQIVQPIAPVEEISIENFWNKAYEDDEAPF